MESFVKIPCKHCPFRIDVKPYLHPDRAYDIASENPYSSFACHKTTISDEESEEGRMLTTEDSKECAGFLTLRANSGESLPKGFKPSFDLCYGDSLEMYQAYDEEWNNNHRKNGK